MLNHHLRVFARALCALFVLQLYLSENSSCELTQSNKPPLRFRADGGFKIVQFADLHFGEGEDVAWGAMQDINSTRVMRDILSIEKPDFVVFSGDQVTGNNIVNNATTYWGHVVKPLVDAGVRWASILGNHDDLSSGANGSRTDLISYDMTYDLSYSQLGPRDIHGVSNYFIPIQSSRPGKQDNPAFLMYFLDSMDTCPLYPKGWGCVMPDQVDWFDNLAQDLQNKYSAVIPSFMFVHIPLQEHMFMYNTEVTYGTNNDSVSCQAVDTGLFWAFKKPYQNVLGCFVGHNHGNDFCGDFDGVQLCFGRHSGYGGYGTWERGARVMEIKEGEGEGKDGGVSWTTWIRYEDGRREDRGVLHKPQPPYQSKCD